MSRACICVTKWSNAWSLLSAGRKSCHQLPKTGNVHFAAACAPEVKAHAKSSAHNGTPSTPEDRRTSLWWPAVKTAVLPLLPCCPLSSPHVCTAGCTAAAVRRTADASSLHRLRCTSYGTGPPRTVHQSTCTTHRTCSVTAVVSTLELSPTQITTFKLVDQTSHGLVELVLVLFRRTHNAAWSSKLESFPAL